MVPHGFVPWGTRPDLDGPGVYVVTQTKESESASDGVSLPLISGERVRELLDACLELRLDGMPPKPEELVDRLSSFLVPDQTVLYIGKAGTSVRGRVRDYYSTPLGAQRPHAGGWVLKTLAQLDSLFVYFASSPDPESSERSMLKAFIAGVSAGSRQHLHDPSLPLPFANLELKDAGKRIRKKHGISGATGCG